MKTKQAFSTADRAFSLLRTSTSSWRVDASGYWSYPALVRDSGGTLSWLHIILLSVPMPEKKRTALFRPKAVVTTKPNLPEIVSYQNLRTGKDRFPDVTWDKPLAMFPHKSVANMTYEKLREAEAELMALYPEAEAVFARSQTLPPTFIDAYLGLIHPVFLPFIRQLAPPFFNALGVEKRAAR